MNFDKARVNVRVRPVTSSEAGCFWFCFFNFNTAPTAEGDGV